MAQNDKLDQAISARLAKLRQKLSEEDLDALLVTSIDNVRYISGFTGSTATVVVSQSKAVIFVDSRYTLQATEQCRLFEVLDYKGNVYAPASAFVGEIGATRLAFEASHLSYADYRKVRPLLTGISFVATSGVLDELRLVKDDYELDVMTRAIEMSDKCFEDILSFIKPGLTEKEVALQLEICMRRHGADKAAFDTIVAAGPHAALPHAQPSDRVLEHGQLLKMDYGAEYQQYPSDLTRTVCLGEPDAKQREVYQTVLDAQLKAIDAVRPGVAGKAIDAVAREHIASAGYGDYFGHGLGHSLGRGVHDGPGLSPTSPIVLEPGMVMTVEPGIYIPGWGGVRIEDDVLVTDDGCRILTKATKELIAL